VFVVEIVLESPWLALLALLSCIVCWYACWHAVPAGCGTRQVNRVLEVARKERAIGSPLEAAVTLAPADGAATATSARVLSGLGARELADVCQTSQAELLLLPPASSDSGAAATQAAAAAGGDAPFSFAQDVEIAVAEGDVATHVSGAEVWTVRVTPARGSKCSRCWQYTAPPVAAAGSDGDAVVLCARCEGIVAAVEGCQ